MKQFNCGDVVPGCTATFQHETDDEILGAVAAHAAADHDMADVPPEVVEAVRAKIITI
jgi:predicted small metal-binding protein